MSLGMTYSPTIPGGGAASYKLWPVFTYHEKRNHQCNSTNTHKKKKKKKKRETEGEKEDCFPKLVINSL